MKRGNYRQKANVFRRKHVRTFVVFGLQGGSTVPKTLFSNTVHSYRHEACMNNYKKDVFLFFFLRRVPRMGNSVSYLFLKWHSLLVIENVEHVESCAWTCLCGQMACCTTARMTPGPYQLGTRASAGPVQRISVWTWSYALELEQVIIDAAGASEPRHRGDFLGYFINKFCLCGLHFATYLLDRQ